MERVLPWIARTFSYGAMAWLMLVAGKAIRWLSMDILVFAVLACAALVVATEAIVGQAKRLRELRLQLQELNKEPS